MNTSRQRRATEEDVIIQAPEEIIKPGAADIVVLCTDSFTKEAFPRMKFILEQGINCITSAEEMAYPKAQNPDLAEELDKIAKENGVSILGTGINPGHIMDLLVLVMTGCMTDVEAHPVQKSQLPVSVRTGCYVRAGHRHLRR